MVRIAFLQQDAFFRPGIASLISVLKENDHKCKIFIRNNEADFQSFFNKIRNFNPEIIGFSCTTGEYLWAKEVAKIIKKKLKIHCVFGGPHPTFCPEIIEEEGVDIVCIGEGEHAMIRLANSIDKKRSINKINNLWVKENGTIHRNEIENLVEDLDEFPFADRDCYDEYPQIKNKPTADVFFSRGCPFSCSYCHNSKKRDLYKGKGRYMRQRSVKSVIKELKMLKERYPNLKAFRIHDDLFIFNKKWLFDFLRRYKKDIAIPFICQIRADVSTEEIIKRLKESYCDRVSIGVECGNEDFRREILNKPILNSQILKVAGWCHKYNLRMTTYNMIGLPDETVNNAIETIVLNSKIKPEIADIFIFQPYPKAPISDYAIERGLLDYDYNLKAFSTFVNKNSVLKQKNIKELVNLYMFFELGVKHPRLIPLIKILIKIPTNRFFYFFSTIGHMRRSLKYDFDSLSGKISFVLRRMWNILILKNYDPE